MSTVPETVQESSPAKVLETLWGKKERVRSASGDIMESLCFSARRLRITRIQGIP